MNGYNDYTITVAFTSSVGSAFQSDIIFGHICWAMRYLKGEDSLLKFLGSYEGTNAPPLLVSNGFPRGYLPKPLVLPVTQEEIQAIVAENKDDRIQASQKISNIKKMELVPRAILEQFEHDTVTPSNLFSKIYNSYKSVMEGDKGRKTVAVQHNTIDRALGSVRKGGFYAQEETFFDPSSASFEIYLKVSELSKKELTEIFKYISVEGFGRDGSIGKGHFEFSDSAISDGIDLPEAEDPNAFMTLSSYIPAAGDPTRGLYKILHKYGKLGGLYAKGTADVYGNPFKMPLIMFSAGSTFFDKEYHGNKVYGLLIDKIHKNELIRHYAYAFPMGLHIEDKHEKL